MTRVILVGDIHVSDKAPSSCTDSYTDDILDMLYWIADYAKLHDIPTVVWAGDIFNHKQPGRNSHALVIAMIKLVRYHAEQGIELLIVIGNHDISNDVAASAYDKQPLGVLFAAGAKELNGWHASLPIYGVPWQQRWLHEDTPEEAFTAWRLDVPRFGDGDKSKCLAVTHAPIYPPTTRDEQLFELVPTHGPHGLGEAMGHTGYLYYGHIHEDHGVFEDEGVTYANMGAISRGSLHEYNREREIKVALWTDGAPSWSTPTKDPYGNSSSIEETDPLGFSEIPVPHKPASQVFKLTEAAAVKENKLSLDKFLNEVGSSTLDISSTESVIAHIKTLTAPPRVKKTSIEILEEVG